MAKATAAKRAKKPQKVTAKQLAAARGETVEKAEAPKRKGIMTVLVGEHMSCPTPVPREDLYEGQPEFQQPYGWGSITFRLVRRDGAVHYYEEVRQ